LERIKPGELIILLKNPPPTFIDGGLNKSIFFATPLIPSSSFE